MVTSEADVPSDDGAQAGAGAPAEETASDDIDCRRAASSEGGAGMEMMMMFIGTETLVTQLVREISRMQAC